MWKKPYSLISVFISMYTFATEVNFADKFNCLTLKISELLLTVVSYLNESVSRELLTTDNLTVNLRWVTSAACDDMVGLGDVNVGPHRKQLEHMEALSPHAGSTCAAERNARTSESQPLCLEAFYKLVGKRGHSEREVGWRTQIPDAYCQNLKKNTYDKSYFVERTICLQKLRKHEDKHIIVGVFFF